MERESGIVLGEVAGEKIDWCLAGELLVNEDTITIKELVRLVGVEEEREGCGCDLHQSANGEFSECAEFGVVWPDQLTQTEEGVEAGEKLCGEKEAVMVG